MKKAVQIWISGMLMAAVLCFCAFSARAEDRHWPEASGETVKQDEKMKVDASHTGEGYFMACVTGKSSKRMKLRVQKDDVTWTYDLNSDGKYEVFPFQLGSGKYVVSLWQNTSGKKYAQAGKVTLNVTLNREDASFLIPNQYVNYTALSEAVKKADALCQGKNAQEAFEAVQDFLVNTFVYDYVKAVTVQPGMLPDIDGTYKSQRGVCQDLSAVMVCMLRTQGISSRLIIGYADKNYHAWTVTEINGKEIFFDPTAALNSIATPKNYSVERYY